MNNIETLGILIQRSCRYCVFLMGFLCEALVGGKIACSGCSGIWGRVHRILCVSGLGSVRLMGVGGDISDRVWGVREDSA